MSDLVQNSANIVPSGNAPTTIGNSGAAITAGQPVYYNGTNWLPAKANGNAMQAGGTQVGIAQDSAPGTGQNVIIQTSGAMNVGATLTNGVIYCISNTTGAICPVTDLGAGNFITILGMATSTTILTMLNSGPYACPTAHG
jgi:hypothetical protein